MKKGWQIIIAVVSIMILLGGICVGVGFITGAEFDRIFTVVDNRYNVTVYADWFREEVLGSYIPSLRDAWNGTEPAESVPAESAPAENSTEAPAVTAPAG